ncbi:MAG: hypothetical protein ACRDRP_10565 [Pseudonocardiaceae bacterium]
MLVLLPPSETKASGGDGPPLRLDALSHPELTPTRRTLVDELVWLAGNVAAGRVALLAGVAGLVVDLRSGAYAAMGPLPVAVTVYVLSEDGRGRRRTVSHHNKAHKGRLARLLATAPREVSDADGVARIAHRGGLRVERTGEHALDLIVPA